MIRTIPGVATEMTSEEKANTSPRSKEGERWKIVKRKERRKTASWRCTKCRWSWDPCYRKPYVPPWKEHYTDLPTHSPDGREYTDRELVEEAKEKASENMKWDDWDWDSD